MKLSRYEQETIISFNEDEKTAEVYTHNTSLQRRLAALAKERPNDCKLVKESHDGQAVTYIVPKRWVKIRANRILTEEQLAKARAHAAAMLQRRNAGDPSVSEEDIDTEEDILADAEGDDIEDNPMEDGEG